ncbi:MAG: carboxymuconolactone decarboxylase family protein [Fibrobacter sp.]|nr:carboxymuconolactone decarboxylase family protein [Fibrobacter sp.]
MKTAFFKTFVKSMGVAVAISAAFATTTNAQIMKNVLTIQQQDMAIIACLEAQGDLAKLSKAIDKGLDEGLTVSQVKEALSQLYAYTGFPRSLNALGTLQKVLDERRAAGKKTAEGKDASPLPKNYNSLKAGTEVQTKLFGKVNNTFAPATDYYLKAHLFGDIFARDNLTMPERELVTVAALSGMDGVHPQLAAHKAGAKKAGLTDQQVESITMTLQDAKLIPGMYGGDSPWPRGVPNVNYAKYFIGNSYLAPMDAENGGPTNVTFEPACRNNWHIHHNQVQVLIAVSGRGWYVEEGKEPLEMTPGTVVAIPEGKKHWHGAAKDSWFQHLTYHTHVGENASNEWLEPVVDEVYNKLP